MRDDLYYNKANQLELSVGEGGIISTVSTTDGRYSFSTDEVIEGGKTRVYYGWDRAANSEVRMKMPYHWECPKVGELYDDDILKLYLREAWALQQIQGKEPHPNIIKLIDFTFFEREQRVVPVVVMESAKGESLASIPRSILEDLPLDIKLKYLEMLAGAVDYTHGKGMLIRDLSPKSVVLSLSNQDLKLIDFGEAGHINEKREEVSGSPGFIPPDVLNGSDWSIETERWAFIAIAYYLLSNGSLPFGRSLSLDPEVAMKENMLSTSNPKNYKSLMQKYYRKHYETFQIDFLEGFFKSMLVDGQNKDNCSDIINTIKENLLPPNN